MQQTNSGAESGAASYAMSGASATRRASGAVRGEIGFYSALASAIEGCKQGEAATQGWSDLIKGLVNKGLAKQDEVEWTGLEDWLSLQDGRISKEQVLDYLEQHGVQVVEDRLAAGNKEWFVRDRSSLEVIESGFESEDAAQIWAEDNLGTSFREQYKILQNDESTGDARYGDYTQRGGTNYREIILRLPESRVLPQRERFSLFHEGTLIAQGMWPPSRRTQESLATNPNLRVQREWVPDQNEARRQGVYLSTHWAQTNVLAHLRLTDRVGVDGRQVLFVEEIQSDWAQDGRRNGFAQKTQGEASGAAGSVPVGPFVTKTEGWLSLALKRVLVMAAEGGYEAVAFISGEQSAARYKLAQPIDRAAITRTGGVWAVTAWHKDSAAITRDVTTDAALRELVGKELAARAIADGGGEYKGLNLSFGGNGMRAFYDTIVPNTLKALLKKLGIDAPMQAIKLQGASAEMAAFPAGEKWVVTDAEDGRIEHGKFATLKEAMDFMRGAASQQVSLPVTEALRERVRTGMPLFSRKGRTQGVTPSAAANEPPTGSESKSIEDPGEKIGGARKDRWRERGLNLDDLNSMSINAAFEGLIKTIKVQETERGVMLFEPDAEYADEDERITRISHSVTDDQLLQKFLDEGPVESQTGSAAKASQREAASAVKDIRSTATPLGRVLSRDYAARQRINLVGQKIESAQDLAVLAQVYRDPRFETFRVLFVNDVGDVVSQVGLTSRLPASVQVIMGDDMDAYLAELSTAARSSGATGYYLLHNHPSGVATPSQADINLTKQFAAKMPGLNLHRHVVIDTNEYACIDGDGEFELMKIDLGRPALFTAPEWDGLNISGPKDVMAVAKRLQADQGAVTLIHTDSQHKVRFVDAIPPSVAMSDQETVRRHVLKVSLRHGGAKVFAVSRNKLALARMSDLIVDGIHVNDLGHTWSMMENGAMPGGQLFPQTRRARLSPDTSPEFAYLRSTPSSARQMDAKDPGLKTVDQINSGSFKRWFGDSKVVDSYGRPLRVYHGSVGKRTVFESHWRQLERDALPHELIGSGSIAQIYKQAKEEPELHFFAALRDTAETYGPDVTEAYLQIANMVGNPDMASHEAIELMLQLDADGAIFRETTSSGAYGGVAYVVRKSSQIKSAVDNMGAFDPGEADIRLSRDIPGIGAGESGHIRSALKQAYGTLLEQLESASLVRLNRNLEAALDAAAQARSLRSGVDVAQERQMLASHMLASHTFAGHAPAGHAPAGYVTSAAGIDVKRSAAGDIQGFFDPVAQQAYLIEEHLTPSSAPGVLMHEIGVHMAYDRADSPQQRQLMRAFVRARQILSEGAQHTSDPGLAAAIQQASDRMSDAGETSAEEAAAYLVEAIENHRIRHLAAQQDPSNLGEVLGGWLQETASSVRAWLFSKGVLIDAQDLTAYDIAALARGKAHNLASESSSNRLRKDLTRSLDHALAMAGTRARRFSLRVAEIINPPHQPLGLYSALQSEVGSVRASALTATGWKDVVAGWVNKGTVKSAEVEWSGLVEWLDLQDGQSGRVSRQEVMTYLMAHGVRVEEVERTEKTVIPQKERVGQLEPQAEAGSGPKYQRYTLPGGSNYREVLLKLPARPGRHTLRFADGKHRIWSNDKQDWARRPDGVLLSSYDSEADGLRAMGVMGGAHSRNFCDNHWGEVNVLAHLRLDDRIDAEGRKTLFVEEVQSDWGQIGKRGGFAKIGSGDPSGIQLGSVPDAPFVTKTEGWLSLALKRVLVMAAEGGYEAVAFISGEQSAARYDLSKQIDRAHIARTDDAWAVHAWKNGTKVITRVASKNDELQEIIGKDLAERAIADGGGEYQGLDLQVGGKGMRAFYDVILPNTLKSIFKKIGTGKLDSVRFGDDRRSYDETQALLNDYAAYPIGSSDRQALLDYLDVAPDYGYSSIRGTQTGFAVTDDLREKVSHGLPLFSRRGLADADLDADDRSEDDKSRCNPEARDDLEPDEHQKSDLAPRC